jgi:uncharacterized phage infection (PIP) family protein YhgE
MNNNEQISRSGSSVSGSNRPRNQPEGPAGGSQDSQAKSGDAVSRLTEVAQQAGSQVKQTVTSLASEANQKAKGVLNQQLTAGAELVANGAESAKHAADNLNENAPRLADLVRRAADKIDGLVPGFARTVHRRSHPHRI